MKDFFKIFFGILAIPLYTLGIILMFVTFFCIFNIQIINLIHKLIFNTENNIFNIKY